MTTAGYPLRAYHKGRVLRILGKNGLIGGVPSLLFFKAWFPSALAIASATFYGIIGLFPNMFPSSLNTDYSLTAHNASSSPLTLKIMLVVTLIFIPIVFAYQIWTYNLFKGKVLKEDLAYGEAY